MTTAFETTVSMSTYLLAFVVSDYTYLENANAKPLQRVYSQPPKLQDSHFALEAGVRVMNSLESYLNVDYSLEKIDQFGIPQFAGSSRIKLLDMKHTNFLLVGHETLQFLLLFGHETHKEHGNFTPQPVPWRTGDWSLTANPCSIGTQKPSAPPIN